MRLFLIKIKFFLFKTYSTDIAFRYFPVIDIIRAKNLLNSRILEVGSGDVGISLYLKKKVVGLDIKFEEESNPMMEKIKYAGNKFPFFDKAFDLVISVDSLEHVKPEERAVFIEEMMRVARKAVLIIAPFGKTAYEHDKRLEKYFYKVNQKKDFFLEEHIKNGPLEEEVVKEMIHKSAKKLKRNIKIKEAKSLNEGLRFFIMRLKISKNIFANILYYLLLVLLPFRSFLNFGNCYRSLIYLDIK